MADREITITVTVTRASSTRADAVLLAALNHAFPTVRIDVNRRDAVMARLHEMGVDVDALDATLAEGDPTFGMAES